MSVSLTSVSPSCGPPGTAIALTGAGFDAGSQVCCPTVALMTFVSSTQLIAAIPANLAGPDGGTTQIGVFVLGSDGSISAVILFSVQFPPAKLQAWTTVDAVTAEVPGFKRGGIINDDQIGTWIRSIAQNIAAEMVRRGLSLDPSTWQQPGTTANPDPVDVLEMINRMGAASRLASAIGAQFGAAGQQWGVAKNLESAYQDQLHGLREGDCDKFFLPAAATVDVLPQLAASTGGRPAFRKEQVF